MDWLLDSGEIGSGRIVAEEIGFVRIDSEEGIEFEVIGFGVQKHHRLQCPYHCHSRQETCLSSPHLEICLQVDV